MTATEYLTGLGACLLTPIATLTEEIGLDDGVTALKQLGLIRGIV